MKMQLCHAEFMNDMPGRRFDAGDVLDVDDDTADRWRKLKVAVDAGTAVKTTREETREELMAKLALMDRDDALAPKAITRGESADVSGPVTPKKTAAKKPAAKPEETVTPPDDDDDDDAPSVPADDKPAEQATYATAYRR